MGGGGNNKGGMEMASITVERQKPNTKWVNNHKTKKENHHPKQKLIVTKQSKHSIWKDVLWVFILTRILIYAISLGSYSFLHQELPSDHQLWHNVQPSQEKFLRIWEKWDSIHYLSIMENGYSYFKPAAMNTAFFPLYPIAGYTLNLIIQNRTLALLLVSNLTFLFALFFIYKLVRLDETQDTTRRTIFYLSIFPFSLFFAGAYTESLFLLNLAATIYYIRTAQFGKATLFGFLLTATRLVGSAALIAVFIEYQSYRQEINSKKNWQILLFGIMGLGLVFYMLYTYLSFGNFFSIFESSQNGWNRQLSWPWESLFSTLGRMQKGSAFPIFPFNLVLSFISIALCIVTFKKLRISYAWLSTLLLLIPLSSGTLKSFPRYMIVIFPLFILLGRWGQNRYVDMAITAISLIYLGMFTTLYSNWLYIG
ncbi:hypothetical protein GF406_25140 [candidate division KSB1 bacterium]|nr:hypothetical protein [candidate division KSB1 bacterium]